MRNDKGNNGNSRTLDRQEMECQKKNLQWRNCAKNSNFQFIDDHIVFTHEVYFVISVITHVVLLINRQTFFFP